MLFGSDLDILVNLVNNWSMLRDDMMGGDVSTCSTRDQLPRNSLTGDITIYSHVMVKYRQ